MGLENQNGLVAFDSESRDFWAAPGQSDGTKDDLDRAAGDDDAGLNELPSDIVPVERADPDAVRDDDSGLNDLAAEIALMQRSPAAEPVGGLVFTAHAVTGRELGQEAWESAQPGLVRVSVDPTAGTDPDRQSTPFAARMAVILLAAGLGGHAVVGRVARIGASKSFPIH
jgi:hypothetical protein